MASSEEESEAAFQEGLAVFLATHPLPPNINREEENVSWSYIQKSLTPPHKRVLRVQSILASLNLSSFLVSTSFHMFAIPLLSLCPQSQSFCFPRFLNPFAFLFSSFPQLFLCPQSLFFPCNLNPLLSMSPRSLRLVSLIPLLSWCPLSLLFPGKR